MITHSVFMNLKHPRGSKEEKAFLNECQKLGSIPEVLNYQVVRETSPKNSFTFGLLMNFKTQEDYDSYNNHPDHIYFVEKVWNPNVDTFQEIDYESFQP